MTPLQLTKSVRSLNRLRRIAQVLTRHGFGHVVAQLNLGRFVPVRVLRKKAAPPTLDEGASAFGRRLARVFTDLGPTFIKLGQMLSTRPDVVPPDVLTELRSLQDDVPPFDNEAAMQVIRDELGRPLEQCYAHIADEPFASASIGQVYRARGCDGAELVVKVRRPGVEQTIELDILLLRWMAESLESLMPEARVYRPTMLVDEFDQALHRELDYINEASATARFANAFADDIGIHIPKVYWDLTATRVLTLEAIEGTNVDMLLSPNESPDGEIDRRLVARRLADCYLKQIFEIGSFHADPHPGNILLKPPATVGLIDFGQVGTLGEDLMTDLVVVTYAGVNGEMDAVIETFDDMGALTRETDRAGLQRALQIYRDKYYGLPLKRFDVGTLFTEFTEVMRRHDVVIPRDLALLVKALGTVGTLGRRLDPDLNLLELLQPRIKKAFAERFSPTQVARTATLVGWDIMNIVRRAPGQLRGLLRRLSSRGWELHVHHENLDRLIRELDRSSNRLAFSVVIAAIIVGSSMVVSTGADVELFGIQIRYFGIIGYLIAGVLGLGLSWAIFRSGRLH